MTWNLGQCFVVLEIIGKLAAFVFFPCHYSDRKSRFLLQKLAQFGQQVGIFREAFHQNVFGAVESGLGVGHALVGIHKFSRGFFRR